VWSSTDGSDWLRVATLDIERFAAFQATQIEAGPADWVIIGKQPNGPETADGSP
jgi:hypothetical protein